MNDRRRFVPPLRSLLLAVLVTACSPPEVPRARDASLPGPIRDAGTGTRVGVDEEAPAARPETGAELPLIVFLGDSLTAGYGLSATEAYPAHVGRLLAERGLPVRIVNAGVSGDTSAGGLERLDWFLAQGPDLVLVELGGNDGLRGQPLAATEANLGAIVERALAAGAAVVLAGMRIPPSYGPEYVAGFEAIFPRLSDRFEVDLIPFLLEGVAADPELNLPDGIHPNARGQRIVAETVAEALEPLIAGLRRSG